MARLGYIRSIYDPNEPTVGEGIARGIQGGLDWYAARRETARQEGNTVGAQGGVRLPDQPRPSIGQRIRGIGRAIGEVVHGSTPGMQPTWHPTGTFVDRQPPPDQPGDFAQSGDQDGDYDPGDSDRDGDVRSGSVVADMLGRVVRPTGPVDALPPSPRPAPALGRAQPAMASAGPTAPLSEGERSFIYEGSDGARYRMPQTGERERVNAEQEYERRTRFLETLRRQREQEQIDALIAGGVDPEDARAEVLTGTTRYDDRYGQNSRALTYEERANLERLKASLKAKVSNGTATSEDRRRLREIQEGRLQLDRQKFEAGNDRAVAGAEATQAGIRQRGVVTNPMDQSMMGTDAQRQNRIRQAKVDEQLQRAASATNRMRNRTATAEDAARRIRELKRMGITDPRRIRGQMKAEGYPEKY
jgi:hypothetical protein